MNNNLDVLLAFPWVENTTQKMSSKAQGPYGRPKYDQRMKYNLNLELSVYLCTVRDLV